MADNIYAIIIPIAIVVVVLKVSLICCRIWFYQKRRERQLQIIQQRRDIQAGCATARVVSVRRIHGPGGVAQQTSYAIEQPGCPTQQLTRTVIVRPASRRPNDPNLPPSYDQAVTGADRSVRVQEASETLGKNPLQQPLPLVQLPPQRTSAASAPSAPLTLPHMPPPRNDPSGPPPAYNPAPSAPSPDIIASDRQSLLP